MDKQIEVWEELLLNASRSQMDNLSSSNSKTEFEGGMEPGDLLGAKILWRRRYPRPFEIVCCDRGYTPLPGVRPYKIYCDIPHCKQGCRVGADGFNEKESTAQKSSKASAQKPKEGLKLDDDKSISIESQVKESKQEVEEERNDVGYKVVGRCVQNYP